MKRARHEVVVDLINRYDIETQEELAAYLRKEGFEVTQATVSRDIRELHLSKIAAGNGKQKYIILQNETTRLSDKYIRVLRDGFVSMDMAQNILVIKTVQGMAMAVAAAWMPCIFRRSSAVSRGMTRSSQRSDLWTIREL